MIDGGLRRIFREKFPDWQWTAIESGAVSPGTPDVEYCAPDGISGWIEYKKSDHWKVYFQRGQVPWVHKRARLGGRVFIAIRRKQDELFLISGDRVLDIEEQGLRGFEPVCKNGIRNWNWKIVESILLGKENC